MTPKEKAIELYNKLRNELPVMSSNIRAKKCALITVDEILRIVPSVYLTGDEYIHSGHYQYWYQVRQEIEKI